MPTADSAQDRLRKDSALTGRGFWFHFCGPHILLMVPVR